MNDRVRSILAKLRDSPEFAEQADFSDVNVCAIDGDNALHWVVRWGDRSDAKALIDAGINVNQAGDLGYTPLHVACMLGDLDMVMLLIENGANLFAMSEGDTPFASARISGHDNVCDSLAPLMKQAQSQDPKIWVRARIAQLQREIAELDKKIKTKS
jgi:ankyrin repeat protein